MKILKNLFESALVISIAGTTVMALSMPSQAGERSLKAKEVRALFPGNYEARVRGYKIAVVAKRNGSLAGSAFNQADSGRWWINENELCVAWVNWTDGKATCGRTTKSGSRYVSRNASGNKMKFRRN